MKNTKGIELIHQKGNHDEIIAPFQEEYDKEFLNEDDEEFQNEDDEEFQNEDDEEFQNEDDEEFPIDSFAKFQAENYLEFDDDHGGEFRYENGEFLYEDEVRMAKSTWNHMRDSFALEGNQGITYHRIISDNNIHVEHLEKRDRLGHLLGYIQYWPEDSYGATEGEINIMVDPKYWRKGIGTELLDMALQIWPIDLNDQTFSSFGRKFF